jgi:hypothetical protein
MISPPSKERINSMIERNDLHELKAFHKEFGIGQMTRSNYNYHINCYFNHINSKNGWDSQNRANAVYWSYRAKVLDSIISHPMYRTSALNLPCVTQQLEEVN